VRRPREPTLDALLDLDGQVLVVDPSGGHSVRFVVTRVPMSLEKPHGLDYSLTLHGPSISGRGGRGVAEKRSDPMTTLKVGIASYDEMKARTLRIARGEHRVARGEPRVWFTSTESFAKVLSAGNRDLLRVIAEKAPSSLDELAQITGRAKSNLSRTLKTMEGYGLVRLERGERGRITPKVAHDRVELELPLTLSKAGERQRRAV
jgi:predicted transcriptional regulator